MKGCIGCHSLQAVDAPKGMIGPNLATVGSRAYIAAGWLRNTDENLEHWIREPQTVKKGVLMPNLGVTAEEAKALGRTSAHINNGIGHGNHGSQTEHGYTRRTARRPGSGAGSRRSITSGSGSSTARRRSSSSCWAGSRRC